jgi:hypothetical protein
VVEEVVPERRPDGGARHRLAVAVAHDDANLVVTVASVVVTVAGAAVAVHVSVDRASVVFRRRRSVWAVVALCPLLVSFVAHDPPFGGDTGR